MAVEDTVQHIYLRSRGAGCTQALVDGLKNYRGPGRPLVVSPNENSARDLRERLKRAGVSADVESIQARPERFLGRDLGPAVMDLPAAMVLVAECQRLRGIQAQQAEEIGQLSARLRQEREVSADLRHQLETARLRIEALENVAAGDAPSLGGTREKK